MTSIQIRRIETKLKDMYMGKLDFSDQPTKVDQLFPTRALAALALMMKCGVDTDISGKSVTDGFNDMGIDAMYLDEPQKQLFVVQSKWRENGQGSISQKEMLTLTEGINRILNLDIDGANSRIQNKKGDIDFALTQIDYQIHVVYIHTGNTSINEYALRSMKQLMSSTNDDVSTLVVFDELLYSDVYRYLAQGLDVDSITLDDVILQNWGRIDSPYIAYYGTVSAAVIGDWFKTYGNALFAKNIRFYKGNTDVNEGMLRVLMHEPEKFYYYNNGIKLLCKSIKRKAKDSTNNLTGLFTLQGVSLVNGAQTAGSIGNAFLRAPEQVAKASVMIQIIDLGEASEETSLQITKLSNTQNRIDNRDFAALDPNQEKLRQDMSFSHYAYLYKGGDQLTDPTTQLTFDEAIIALACCHDEISYATLAKRNVGGLSEDISKPPYTVLMNSGTNAFSVINSVLMVRRIDNYLTLRKSELSGKERLVVVHGNRFIEHCVLQGVKRMDGFCETIMNIDGVFQGKTSEIDTLIGQTTHAINELYIESYPANIFKNATKCKMIKDKIYGVA